MTHEVLQTSYEIMQPVVADAEELVKMRNQSWRDTYPSDEHGVSTEYIEQVVSERENEEGLEKRRSYIRESHENPSYFLRIARDNDGSVVGYIDGNLLDDGTYEVGGLYIDKATHGSGLAQQLWQEYIAWADAGKKDIKLCVATHNERAKAFYRKVGFVEQPESVRIYRNGVMQVVDMIRKGENDEI